MKVNAIRSKTFNLPKGYSETYYYDKDNNLVFREDSKGNTEELSYDSSSRLIKAQTSAGVIVEYTYTGEDFETTYSYVKEVA